MSPFNFSSCGGKGCCKIGSLGGKNANGKYFKENAIDTFDTKEMLGECLNDRGNITTHS
jgi:hypothetical protein